MLSASASVRNTSAAPSLRAGDLVEGHLLAGGEPRPQVDQRGVGHAAGERVVDQLDRVLLAAELREDLGMRDDRRPVEMQRSLVAAGEDRLGGDEVAGQRQRQRLVVLAVGDSASLTGHRVELGLARAAKSSRPDLDPAGEEPPSSGLSASPRGVEHLSRRCGEVLGRERIADAHQRRDLVARVGRASRSASGRARRDVADATLPRRVVQEPGVVRVERQRLVVVGRGLGDSRRGSPPASRRGRPPTRLDAATGKRRGREEGGQRRRGGPGGRG